jgi:hypothetical protein
LAAGTDVSPAANANLKDFLELRRKYLLYH